MHISNTQSPRSGRGEGERGGEHTLPGFEKKITHKKPEQNRQYLHSVGIFGADYDE